MKKILLLFAAVTTIVFAGCSDDDEKVGSDELVGTKWVYEEVVGDIPNHYWRTSITFNSVNEFTYHAEDEVGGKIQKFDASGSYTYNPPTITGGGIADGEKFELHAEVNGDQMTVYIDGEMLSVMKKSK